MTDLLFNRWFQIAATGTIAAVVSTVIGFLISSGGPELPLLGPVAFVTGGHVEQTGGDKTPEFALGKSPVLDVPLTAAAAVAAGWKDPAQCSVGRGRYFQQGPADEVKPYLLMYNGLDELIGVYLYNKTELPTPWERQDSLESVGDVKVIDFEHWGLFVYFQDPARACATTEADAGT